MPSEVTVRYCQRPDQPGEFYWITFSTGGTLCFTEEEVLENGLYEEGKCCEDFTGMCTVILAKRMMAETASYVLFTSRTEHQIRQRLQEKTADAAEYAAWGEFLPDAVEEAVSRLKDLGYIDDAEYCRKYMRTAMRGRPASRAALLNELVYKKGISKEIAEEAVREAFEGQEAFTDAENAFRLLSKKTNGRVPQEAGERRKLYRYLLGKGFSYECIEQALKRLEEDG